MARIKNPTPLQRAPSSETIPPADRSGLVHRDPKAGLGRTERNGHVGPKPTVLQELEETVLEERREGTVSVQDNGKGKDRKKRRKAGLTWALLQERITTTTYGPASSPEKFRFPVFLNTIQSALAALVGYIYLVLSSPPSSRLHIFPSRTIIPPLLLVAFTSSLASPFGYASLAHIDYITFILAKSCKLLPVMFLHLTLYRRRYPLYKYGVVAAVTAGVAIFTLYHPGKGNKGKNKGVEKSSSWGLFLLSINLLLDGLTNSTQDHIFRAHRTFSGPMMMCAQNLLTTALTVAYLLLQPYLAPVLAGILPNISSPSQDGGELSLALTFLTRHPTVTRDILAFALCGAVGQVFIFTTLHHFSSLLLVTVTVTRKMLSMILSVLWFGHRLSGMQWVGVGLVFGGVGAEGGVKFLTR
ncbi:MAG: UDP-galactose transporter [Caeruleum heppii]|nr:MAG: UDP-galactose transporter [Caeruleum heppii]